MLNKVSALEFFAKNKHFINLGLTALATTVFATEYSLNDPMTLIEVASAALLGTQAFTTVYGMLGSNISIAQGIKSKIKNSLASDLLQKYNETTTNSYEEKHFNSIQERFTSNIIAFCANENSKSRLFNSNSLDEKQKQKLKDIYEKEFSSHNIISQVMISIAKDKASLTRIRIENNELLDLLIPIVNLTEKDNKKLINYFKKQDYLPQEIVKYTTNITLFSKFSSELQKVVLDKLTQNQVSYYQLDDLNAIYKNIPINSEKKDEYIQKMLNGEVKFENDVFSSYTDSLRTKYISQEESQESKDKRDYINNCLNVIFDRGVVATPTNLEQKFITEIYKNEFENTMLFEKALNSIIKISGTSDLYAEDILYDFHHAKRTRSNGVEIYEKIKKTTKLAPKDRNIDSIFTIYMARTIMQTQPMSEKNEQTFLKSLNSISSMNDLQSQLLYNQMTFKCLPNSIQEKLLAIKNNYLTKDHYETLVKIIEDNKNQQLSNTTLSLNTETNSSLKDKIKTTRQLNQDTKEALLSVFNKHLPQ